MPPLVAHAFWPLITHSPAASSNFARVRTPETSEPALGSEAQNAATLTSSGVPKQRGIHSPICSPVPCPKIAATAQRGAHDRHADPGVAPEQLLVDDRQRQAGRVGEELGDPFEAVQADLGGLLDDRPGGLLLLVPLVGGRAHDVGGEAVDPVADVLLVLGEREREGHLLVRAGDRCGRGLGGLRGGLSVGLAVGETAAPELTRAGAPFATGRRATPAPSFC